jgi:cortexillin 1/2
VLKGTADERSLILYTSLFFHAFSAKAQKDAHEDQKQKLANLENSLSSAKESREELLRQVSDLEKTNTHKDGVIKELTEENTNLKSEVKGLKDNKTVLESELNTLGLKNKSDSGDLESLRRKVNKGEGRGGCPGEESRVKKRKEKKRKEKKSTLNLH